MQIEPDTVTVEDILTDVPLSALIDTAATVALAYLIAAVCALFLILSISYLFNFIDE